MSVNLLDLAKGYLTDSVMDQASSFLGESKGATQSGFNHILPALMGGMMTKGNSRGGAEELFKLISKPEMGGGLLNNIGDLFGGSQQSNETMNLGGTLLKGLMGDKLGSIVDLVSAASGMKSGSTSSLMKLGLPILMSVIGKKAKTDGLGLDGFMKLLGSQEEHVKKAAPAGFLDNMLGAFGVGGLGAALGSAASGITNAAGSAADGAKNVASGTANAAKGAVTGAAGAAKGAASKVTSTVTGGDNKGKGGFGRILPLLLILGLLALAAFLLTKGCDNKATNLIGDATESVVDGAKEGADMIGDGVGSIVDFTADGFDAAGQLAKDGVDIVEGGAGAIYNVGADMVGKGLKGFESLGKFVSRKVGDIDMIIPEWGFESRLLDFIEGKGKVSDDKTEGWFNLDRVLFETGSANLDVQSQSQIDNIVAIMNANEAVELKVGGYTDNSGDAAANLKLSDARANAVMNAIVAGGVDASRLAAEGYGEQFPVCPANDTPECMAKNRRVAARVTKK